MDGRYGQFKQKYNCIDFTIYDLYYTKISNAMTTVGLKYNLKNNSKQIKLKYFNCSVNKFFSESINMPSVR